ncbi:hypothetical protein CR164_00110 [Prosthecochloris marina]|uniref:Uncharacterized protein n=1 Tax=Prosthecochloris marina TaxID=2017681 RepID=A0A317T8D7_9CHLB|nr:hypothetical protein [Prosthecochloris marina]PWW83009.1 hypothetical protein CR164_00110 [Prosthecochloris marina]
MKRNKKQATSFFIILPIDKQKPKKRTSNSPDCSPPTEYSLLFQEHKTTKKYTKTKHKNQIKQQKNTAQKKEKTTIKTSNKTNKHDKKITFKTD